MTTCPKIFRPWASMYQQQQQQQQHQQSSLSNNEDRSVKLENNIQKKQQIIEEISPSGIFGQFSSLPECSFPANDYFNVYDPLNVYTSFPPVLEDPLVASTFSFLNSANGFSQASNYLNTYLPELYKNQTLPKMKLRPKKFRCPHCKVSFSNNGQLKGHIRIHTGERPFKCEAEKCGKSFTRNEELTRHKRIHTGLRPFPCDHCGKRFGRKDHLKKHVRTHFPQPRFPDPHYLQFYPLISYGY